MSRGDRVQNLQRDLRRETGVAVGEVEAADLLDALKPVAHRVGMEEQARFFALGVVKKLLVGPIGLDRV